MCYYIWVIDSKAYVFIIKLKPSVDGSLTLCRTMTFSINQENVLTYFRVIKLNSILKTIITQNTIRLEKDKQHNNYQMSVDLERELKINKK